jgi:hypothetical protein
MVDVKISWVNMNVCAEMATLEPSVKLMLMSASWETSAMEMGSV